MSAELDGADLREVLGLQADHRNASLDEVDLRGADLRGANLTNAHLSQVLVDGARFEGAVGVESTYVARLVLDDVGVVAEGAEAKAWLSRASRPIGT